MMTKLQRIKRANGTLSYNVNIPLTIIEELEWEKGAELSLEIRKGRDNSMIMVFRNEDEIKDEEVKTNGNNNKDRFIRS